MITEPSLSASRSRRFLQLMWFFKHPHVQLLSADTWTLSLLMYSHIAGSIWADLGLLLFGVLPLKIKKVFGTYSVDDMTPMGPVVVLVDWFCCITTYTAKSSKVMCSSSSHASPGYAASLVVACGES